ncbi:MAG: nuclear transport factor 2 family protein [Janthinobacterium lividum]
MPSSKQIIEGIYNLIRQNNLSKVLPLLDEHVQIHVPESLPFGGIYHGRAGYISLFSAITQTWASLSTESIQYYTRDGAPEEVVVATGELTAQLQRNNAPYAMPFMNHWRLHDGKVTALTVFYWDTAMLLATFHKDLPGTTSANGIYPIGPGTPAE